MCALARVLLHAGLMTRRSLSLAASLVGVGVAVSVVVAGGTAMANRGQGNARQATKARPAAKPSAQTVSVRPALRLPGLEGLRARMQTRATAKTEALQAKKDRLARAVTRARAIVETAEGAATWASDGSLRDATRQVLDTSAGGWAPALADIRAARADLVRSIRRSDRGVLAASDAEVRDLERRVEAVLARPEAAVARPVAKAPRQPAQQRTTAVPERHRTAPWRRPSPRLGQWMDPEPHGPYHTDRAAHARARALDGARLVAALGAERAFRVDVAGAVSEAIEVGASGAMHDHWTAGSISVSDPHSIMDTEFIWKHKVVGNGIGSTLTYAKGGQLSAARFDVDGRDYRIAIDRLDRGGKQILGGGRGEVSASRVHGIRVTRVRTLPIRGNRFSKTTLVTEETLLADGRSHVREVRTQAVWRRGAREPFSSATEVVRDEILSSRGGKAEAAD